MRHERATEELRETASLYALGALTQHEACSLEIHMKEGCSTCEAEVRRFRRAAVTIGFAVDEIAPPDYIHDLLSARIERETQNPAPSRQPNPPAKETNASVPSSLFRQPEKERHSIFAWVLVAALVVAAAVAGYSWKIEQDRTVRLSNELATSRSDMADLQSLLDSRKSRIEELEQLLKSLSKPGSRLAHLKGQPAAPEPMGALVWDRELNECLVVGAFPEPPEGKTYQFWFLPTGQTIPAGILQINPAGTTMVRFAIPEQAGNASSAILTIEPESGSSAPTFPYYALGRFD
ncbi:MAG: anti-sigma factor [Acidobacteria bacterium]|nr:anti-sigma factor [Acidobacteriota bacterium]